MIEYPKRLYRAGKGYTVNNLEEERKFLSQVELLKPADSVDEILHAKEEDGPTDAEKKEEALKYIVYKGYSKNAAKSILKKEGLEAILAAKAEGRDPQE